MDNPQEMDSPQERAKEVRHPDGRIENLSVRREPRDVRALPIVAVFSAGVVLGAVILTIVWGFFERSERKQNEVKASTYPLAPEPSLALPREPRLDPLNKTVVNKEADVYAREAANEARINTFGPADEKGFVRIPIREAMKLAAKQLPVRKEPPNESAGKDSGLRDGGGPNSGRVFLEPPK
jgi:hypothetical protein